MLSMASSSSPRSFSTEDLRHFGCIPLNDDVYEFYRPASGPISMEIVFFHGFQTRGCEDAFIRTWMTRDGSVCWLNTWLVESLPRARILSVSYDSSTRTSDSQGRLDMYLIRENLVGALIKLVGLGRDCPVVLVGHCVGGLVLKEICTKASQIGSMQEESSGLPHRRFLANLKGMFFYSTAHLGSRMPLPANPDQGAPLLRYLYLLNEASARINHEFEKLHRKYDWRVYGVNEANETRTMTLMSIFDHADSLGTSEHILVVPEGSGRLGVDAFATISGVDHFTICNPKDQQSDSFCYLVDFLIEILKEEDESSSDLLRCLQVNVPSNLRCFDDERIDALIALLDLRNPEQIRVSMVGMDGIGKSSLVKQIFVRIQHQFDFVCFLELENAPRNQKVTEFEKLFSEKLYKGNGKKMSLVHVAETPWSLLRNKKVLIIVDDVEAEEQILPLLNFEWCGEGSRLIITTFIKGLMSQSSAFIEFQVPLLSYADAWKLFRAHVDPADSLLRRIPKELVSEILHECEGLPLALKLVGHYLSRKDNECVWRSVLKKLRTREALNGVGENPVWRKLKVIFDDFNLDEQRIFLDLATFDLFGPAKKQYDPDVLKVAWRTGLGSRGSFTDMTLENLRDRCFLQIVPGSRGTVRVPTDMAGEVCSIYIHKLLRNMGKWLSRILNEKGEFQHGQRAWELEDVKDVLNESKEDTAQRNRMVEVLSVAMDHRSRENMEWSSIGRFGALRLLRMSNVNMSEGSDKFILPRNLAMLHMIDCSGPKQRRWCFWPQPHWPIREEKVECLRRLSVLLLDNCRSVRLPQNFHGLTELRILQIHDTTEDTVMQLPETLGLLPALEQLSLSAPVEKLPNSILALPCLKSMELRDCSTLKAWPIPATVDPSSHLTCLTSLELSNLPALTHLPDTFGGLRSLRTLWLEECPLLERLPEGFSTLQQLTTLDIGGCEKLESLCGSFSSLHNLKRLDLANLPALRMLPNNFGYLLSLDSLDFYGCTALTLLPESFIYLQRLSKLNISRCENLVSLWQDPGHFGVSRESKRLRFLEGKVATSLPEEIGQFNRLRVVNLKNCKKLQYLPRSLMQITSLETLYISDCESLVQLPDVTSHLSALTDLRLEKWSKLICLPESVGELKSLEILRLEGGDVLTSQPQLDMNVESCRNLPESLGQLIKLKTLSLTRFQYLVTLPESIGQLTSLKSLTLSSCGSLVYLPDSLCQLSSLEELTLEHCGNLHHLPDSFGQLVSLKRLMLAHCENLQHLPYSFGQLFSLRELALEHCRNFIAFPYSFGQLFSLRELALEHCRNFIAFPDSLGRLASLQGLRLLHCGNFQTFPESLGHLPSLLFLDIRSCENLVGFPESVGQLRRLSVLKLLKCGSFERLPQSICHLKSLTSLSLGVPTISEDLLVSLGQLTKLKILALPACKNPRSLVYILEQFTALFELRVSCNYENLEALLESLQQLSSLSTLEIGDDDHLEHIPESLGQLSQLRNLHVQSCRNLKELPKTLGELTALRHLTIQDCEVIKTLPESIGLCKTLEDLTIARCDSFEGLPESILQLNLCKLQIEQCKSLKELPSSILELDALWFFE